MIAQDHLRKNGHLEAAMKITYFSRRIRRSGFTPANRLDINGLWQPKIIFPVGGSGLDGTARWLTSAELNPY